ncbi:hypothetical protein [Brazilian marseillevirus]|uniref:hypothetical protein n=1 Tax=Brazilian marseillevirus TaxID=1813599 RepID=UPI0007858F8F|nr:hypothetical protein A3303_gp051 [Brazilian marseillevirus]AMQ10559.1 hypothetical protein [Brazilian marseillevirus]
MMTRISLGNSSIVFFLKRRSQIKKMDILEHTGVTMNGKTVYCSCMDGTTAKGYDPTNDEACCFFGDKQGREAHLEKLKFEKEFDELLQTKNLRLLRKD